MYNTGIEITETFHGFLGVSQLLDLLRLTDRLTGWSWLIRKEGSTVTDGSDDNETQ